MPSFWRICVASTLSSPSRLGAFLRADRKYSRVLGKRVLRDREFRGFIGGDWLPEPRSGQQLYAERYIPGPAPGPLQQGQPEGLPGERAVRAGQLLQDGKVVVA